MATERRATDGVVTLPDTGLLEDAATILAAMDVEAGQDTIVLGLLTFYVAIVASDLGLYGMGRLAASTPWARRWAPAERYGRSRTWVQQHVVKLVILSRFLPGARLPSYTACGYFHAGLCRFALASALANLIWATVLIYVGLRLGRTLVTNFGAWGWVGMAGALSIFVAVSRFAAWRLSRRVAARPCPPSPI